MVKMHVYTRDELRGRLVRFDAAGSCVKLRLGVVAWATAVVSVFCHLSCSAVVSFILFYVLCHLSCFDVV